MPYQLGHAPVEWWIVWDLNPSVVLDAIEVATPSSPTTRVGGAYGISTRDLIRDRDPRTADSSNAPCCVPRQLTSRPG